MLHIEQDLGYRSRVMVTLEWPRASDTTFGLMPATRPRVAKAWRKDRTRQLDVLFSGPVSPVDKRAKRRFFGEE